MSEHEQNVVEARDTPAESGFAVHGLEERLSSAATTDNAVVAADDTNFGDYAGAGMEGVGADETLVPILRILQGLSPQLDPGKPEYLPAAKMGMLLDTATQELFDGLGVGVEMIICARSGRFYGMWVSRDAGGGFRGVMPETDPALPPLLRQHGKFRKLPYTLRGTGGEADEAVELVETFQLYVLYAPAGEPLTALNARPAILSFSSASIKVYQGWVSRHQGWRYPQPDGQAKTAPLWQYRWRLKTVNQTNNKGSFYVPAIALADPAKTPRDNLLRLSDPLFARGHELNQQHAAGQLKVDQEATGGAAPEEEMPF